MSDGTVAGLIFISIAAIVLAAAYRDVLVERSRNEVVIECLRGGGIAADCAKAVQR